MTTFIRPTSMRQETGLLLAVQKRVDARLSTTIGAVERLRGSLEPFVECFRDRTEREVHAEVMTALGQEPEPDFADDPGRSDATTIALRSSLLALLDLLPLSSELPVSSLSKTVESEPAEQALVLAEPESFAQLLTEAEQRVDVARFSSSDDMAESTKTVAALSALATSALMLQTRRPPMKADVDRADALIKEFDAVGRDEHALRLFPLLQAIVAEARDVMTQIHLDAPIHRRLEVLMLRIDGFRRALPEEIGFLKGLSPTYKDHWPGISREARRKLARFDADAAASAAAVAKKRDGGRRSQVQDAKTTKIESSSTSLPALSELRARVEAGRGVYLVGGLRVEEKIALLRDRFGLEVGWFSIDSGSSNDVKVVVKRVKKGTVAAVVFLEGLTSHNAWTGVQAACKLAGVPFAMADKGGVASVAAALDEIERQLTATNTESP